MSELPEHNYLNEPKGLKSWLFTLDHKRIGLMYLFAIMFFFFIGGVLAVLLRLELLNPGKDIMEADTYNQFFTLHAIQLNTFIPEGIPTKKVRNENIIAASSDCPEVNM